MAGGSLYAFSWYNDVETHFLYKFMNQTDAPVPSLSRAPYKVTLAITGASGVQYGLRLLQCLLVAQCEVSLMVSAAAQVVLVTETDLKVPSATAAMQAFFSELYGARRASYECLLSSNGWLLWHLALVVATLWWCARAVPVVCRQSLVGQVIILLSVQQTYI